MNTLPLSITQKHPLRDQYGNARVVIADGTIEALKWIAVILMTLDHTNTFVFNRTLPWAYCAGRLAMPIFGFVLAYNLARPGTFAAGTYGRTIKRLVVYGLAATPMFFLLGGRVGGWWPLNVMFMLLVAAGVAWMIERDGYARTIGLSIVLPLGGALVEFWWPGIVFVLAVWWFFKTTKPSALVVSIAALAIIGIGNGNQWAMAALPLMVAAPWVDFKIPRVRHLFYAYYPAHFGIILAVVTFFGKQV